MADRQGRFGGGQRPGRRVQPDGGRRPERVPSDHPSVTTYGTHFERSGGTRRPCLRLPDGVDLAEGDLFRLVLDRTPSHARVVADSSGLLVRGAFDNRRLAREPGAGENRLLAWADDHGRGPGDALDLDEVEPGVCYGLRVPGERTVYEAVEAPSGSLADIARSLDDR